MVEITGTAKPDNIIGTEEDDVIFGLLGNDKLFGKSGLDNILGGNGNDHIEGGIGNDFLSGENGNDKIYGGDGFDYLRGGLGNDYLDPGSDKNSVFGGAGNDVMIFHQDQSINLSGTSYEGGDGQDRLVFDDNAHIIIQGVSVPNLAPFFYANAAYVDGTEILDASIASSLFYVGHNSVPVTVIGTSNIDTFNGRDANETFIGGASHDGFTPGNGSDIIISEENDDDSFHFYWDRDTGTDTITGFNGEGEDGGDLLYLNYTYIPSDGPAPVTVSEQDGHTLFDWGAGSVVVDTIGLVSGLDYFISGEFNG